MGASATELDVPNVDILALGRAAKAFVVALARHALLERTSRLEIVVDSGAIVDLLPAIDWLLPQAWPDLIGTPPPCQLFSLERAFAGLTAIEISARDDMGRLLLRQAFSAEGQDPEINQG